MQVSLETTLQSANNFPHSLLNSQKKLVERPAEDSTRRFIASVLMKKAKSCRRPTKKDIVKDNIDKMHNDLIYYLAERNILCTCSVIELTDVKFLTSLTNLLCSRKFFIRRNNNKVDPIKTGHICSPKLI